MTEMTREDIQRFVGYMTGTMKQWGFTPETTTREALLSMKEALSKSRSMWPTTMSKRLFALEFPVNQRRHFYRWLEDGGYIAPLRPHMNINFRNPSTKAVEEGYATVFSPSEYEWTLDGVRQLLGQWKALHPTHNLMENHHEDAEL